MTSSLRIGHGYDVHRFGEGDFVTLGGVQIPHRFGLLAHSDGDVLLHALSDALLGAAALGDIGRHFPDTDPTFKGADSRVLLRHVLALVKAKGWQVGNVDATIVAQAPKMAPHIEAMRALMGNLLNAQYPVLTWWGILTVLQRAAATITMVAVFAIFDDARAYSLPAVIGVGRTVTVTTASSQFVGIAISQMR